MASVENLTHVRLPLQSPRRALRSTLHHDAQCGQLIAHRIRPLSAGFAVPVFAFFASGVTVIGGGFAAAAADAFDVAFADVPDSPHRRFVSELVEFMLTRTA